jgi:hypothetical protein
MSDGPKILTIDIETSPHLVATFELRNTTIGHHQVLEPTRVICFAAKWRHEDEVMFFAEWFDGGHTKMIEEAHRLLSEADIVVHYNGKRFDEPHLNREFWEVGLTPVAPFQTVDLYQTVRREFRFASNKLAHITERLALTGKAKHEGFGLWLRVMEGDPEARAEMEAYNAQDVVTTEELYDVTLPWIRNHPNVALYVDEAVRLCPNCQSPNVQRRGFTAKQKRSYQRWHCQDCGKWSTGSRAVNSVDLAGT